MFCYFRIESGNNNSVFVNLCYIIHKEASHQQIAFFFF